MASKISRKQDDLDRWLEGQYRQDPHMERRVEALMNEMEIETGLAELRKARGLSQAELARRLGVTQPAVAKIESGRMKNLELKTLAKFVAALNGRLRVQILPGRRSRSLHAGK